MFRFEKILNPLIHIFIIFKYSLPGKQSFFSITGNSFTRILISRISASGTGKQTDMRLNDRMKYIEAIKELQ